MNNFEIRGICLHSSKSDIIMWNIIFNKVYKKFRFVKKTMDREGILQALLKSFEAYYNITLFDVEQKPLTARCEFFEHSERYVISRRAELWSADNEEFLYLLDIPCLTLELFEKWRDFVREDGMSRLHIGPGHMCSYLTLILVCDRYGEDARKALERCRYYKSFHFSLHGWMNFRAALVEAETGRILSNRDGRPVAKILKKVLSGKKRRA